MSCLKAAGEQGGRAPYAASIQAPDFMRFDALELTTLLEVLRDPLAVHCYLLLLCQMRFTSGEFLSSYARLIELMTPPRPERGARRAGPSYKQVRRVIDDLVSVGLIKRKGGCNEAQGELRLFLAPRAKIKKNENI